MTAHEILVEARKLIEDPARWTQQALARDSEGQLTHASSPKAVCWCAQGALLKVCKYDPTDKVAGPYQEAFSALSWAADWIAAGLCDGVADLNDNSSHTVVLNAFDLAAEMVPSR